MLYVSCHTSRSSGALFRLVVEVEPQAYGELERRGPAVQLQRLVLPLLDSVRGRLGQQWMAAQHLHALDATMLVHDRIQDDDAVDGGQLRDGRVHRLDAFHQRRGGDLAADSYGFMRDGGRRRG